MFFTYKMSGNEIQTYITTSIWQFCRISRFYDHISRSNSESCFLFKVKSLFYQDLLLISHQHHHKNLHIPKFFVINPINHLIINSLSTLESESIVNLSVQRKNYILNSHEIEKWYFNFFLTFLPSSLISSNLRSHNKTDHPKFKFYPFLHMWCLQMVVVGWTTAVRGGGKAEMGLIMEVAVMDDRWAYSWWKEREEVNEERESWKIFSCKCLTLDSSG